MVYIVRRKVDDAYFTKNGEWIKNINKDCWLNREQVIEFKEQKDFFLVYTILNPCEKN